MSSIPKSTAADHYQAAGVNIQTGHDVVKHIRARVQSTHPGEVLNSIGGFNALYELPLQSYRQPVLVSSTDGVGTKLKLALAAKQLHHLGADLVAMCVNDIIVSGAKPLFFLDYYATGKLDSEQLLTLIDSIVQGCQTAHIALVGGETAEMPGLYHHDDFDLAGFCVGVVDKANIIDGQTVTAGDTIIGLTASGPHANGYSLIRHLLDSQSIALTTELAGKPLVDWLLEPTRIYVDAVNTALANVPIKAMAHITGGGFYENIPRVLPPNTSARIDPHAWNTPPIFDWIRKTGNIPHQEMFSVFNGGIGFIMIVSPTHADLLLHQLNQTETQAVIIGNIQHTPEEQPHVIIENL